MTRLKRSVAFAAKTAVLATATTLLVVVFPALPIGGDLLDVRFGYTSVFHETNTPLLPGSQRRSMPGEFA